MSTGKHWLITKAETLPLGNMFDPLATLIDRLYIGGVETILRGRGTAAQMRDTLRELTEAREKAQQVVEQRLAETLVQEGTR